MKQYLEEAEGLWFSVKDTVAYFLSVPKKSRLVHIEICLSMSAVQTHAQGVESFDDFFDGIVYVKTFLVSIFVFADI